MRQPDNKRKKLDYPEETEGSRLAAKVRKLASKLTPEEEAEHFRRGMAKFMAASPKKSLALDTNLLLDLAGERDFAHEFREEFQARIPFSSRSKVALSDPVFIPIHLVQRRSPRWCEK